MKIIRKLLLKNVLLVVVLASTDFIYDNSMLNVEALTTKKALNAAVKKERESWQAKLNESQNKVKSLQTDLNNAFNENKKIQNEKAASEKTAKDNLAKITAEKESVMQELTNSKKNFEENSKKLNETIDKMQSEKEKLENDILQQKENLKAAQKEYEDKIKAEQEIARKNLENETNRLNKQISEKTNQLNKTIDSLKKVKQEYSNTKDASASEEVKNLVEIEVLKSKLSKQKTELKALVNIAKTQDEAKTAIINNLKMKINTLNKEFETLVESVRSNELRNLSYIEKLTQKVSALKEKVNLLATIGKAQEKKLLTRIKTLIRKQKETEDKYTAIMEAYQLEEQKNLNLIDILKFNLDNAIKNNKALLKVAKRMNEEKMKEDMADSLSEANQLLKIDILNSKLRDSIQRNSMLLQNTQKIKSNANNLKNVTQKAHSGLSEKVKDLTNKLDNSNKKFEKLKKLYNNPKVWVKEVNSLNAKDIKKLFSKDKLKNGFQKKNFLNNDQKKVWEKIITGMKSLVRNQALNRGYPNKQFISNDGKYSLPNRMLQQNNFEKLSSGFNNINNNRMISSKNGNISNRYYQEYSQIPNYNSQKFDLSTQAGTSKQILASNPEKVSGFQNLKNRGNAEVIKILEGKTIAKTKDDELIDFAIESIVNAVQKMTDNNERQTNASMNLIGAGHELPEKIDAVVKVIKEQFNPEVLNKALDKLSDKYIQKQNFMDESLNHMYGKEGSKIINW